jgi:hypothetical protein
MLVSMAENGKWLSFTEEKRGLHLNDSRYRGVNQLRGSRKWLRLRGKKQGESRCEQCRIYEENLRLKRTHVNDSLFGDVHLRQIGSGRKKRKKAPALPWRGNVGRPGK